MAFEPKQSAKKDALKDYVEVNQRVMEFWQKYPNGRISTEIVNWQDGIIVMKASGYRDVSDQIPFSVGHAYEKEGAGMINATSALENCETSAVGRMLGLGNFSAKKSIASREEVANAIHQQEAITAEKDRSHDPALKAKWALLAGSVDGWKEFCETTKPKKGWTWEQVEQYLTLKIEEKRKEKNEQKENVQ